MPNKRAANTETNKEEEPIGNLQAPNWRLDWNFWRCNQHWWLDFSVNNVDKFVLTSRAENADEVSYRWTNVFEKYINLQTLRHNVNLQVKPNGCLQEDGNRFYQTPYYRNLTKSSFLYGHIQLHTTWLDSRLMPPAVATNSISISRSAKQTQDKSDRTNLFTKDSQNIAPHGITISTAEEEQPFINNHRRHVYLIRNSPRGAAIDSQTERNYLHDC